MKIALIGPVYPYRGGISHYTTLLAEKMNQAGHQVKVFSFRRQYPAFLYPGVSDRDPSRLQLTYKDASFRLDPLFPWTWFSTVSDISQYQPDLVLIMWWTSFWAPAYTILVNLLRLRGCRTAYLIHNVLPHEARFFDRWLARAALGAARDFLTQTGEQTKRLRNLIPKARVVQSTHPVYYEFANQVPTQGEARAKLGLPDDCPVLLFFGIVRAYKGLQHLIEAVKVLKQRGKPVHLLAAGEFWEPEDSYRQWAEQCEVQDQVHLYNRYIPNEEVPDFFAAANVFVAPYVDGTQSGAVNMALGFNLPVVMTQVIAESVSPAALAYCKVVPSGNPVALADAVEEWLSARLDTFHTHDLAERSWIELISAVEQLTQG